MTTEGSPTVHMIANGDAVTSCCGRTPFELPMSERITVDPALRNCGTTADLCHNGHPFEPGVDTDMVFEAREPSPLWCNVCGEARRSAPGVSEAAVDAAERAYGAFGAGMVDALEAAAPLLGARPLLDRAAVGQALRSNLTVNEYNEPSATGTTAAVDAVMELARPMPTREQIADRLHSEGAYCGDCDYTGDCSACDQILGGYADAVLALINGSKP